MKIYCWHLNFEPVYLALRWLPLLDSLGLFLGPIATKPNQENNGDNKSWWLDLESIYFLFTRHITFYNIQNCRYLLTTLLLCALSSWWFLSFYYWSEEQGTCLLNITFGNMKRQGYTLKICYIQQLKANMANYDMKCC